MSFTQHLNPAFDYPLSWSHYAVNVAERSKPEAKSISAGAPESPKEAPQKDTPEIA
jgi:hypothetical protein